MIIENQILHKNVAISPNKQKKLRELATYVYQNSAYWKKVFDQRGLNADSFGAETLMQLPVITKDVLQENLKEMICADRSEVIDYVCTSGTTSKPVHIPLTNNDLERLAYNEYKSILRTGASKEDVFQICTTLDKQFMAGMAYFLGLKKLGAGIIRLGVESLEMHWKTIFELKPTYLIAVPSFVVKLLSYAKNNNIDYSNSSVQKIICIGENIRDVDFNLNTIGKRITELWDVQLFSTYASTEMATAFTECISGNGGHHNEDLLIIELLDQKNDPVKQGEIGELIITTLGIEGLPLLRYKTGDLCKIHTEACACGETSARVSPIIGRTAQRIKYKGTTLFPASIFEILYRFLFVKDAIVLIEKDEYENDAVTIHLALLENNDLSTLKEAIKAAIRVVPKIVTHESLIQLRKKFKLNQKRKLTKVIDLR